jgi:hypothetical protein
MQKHWCVWVAVAGLGVAAACTKQVNVCHQDSDCSDVAYPFCDVDGQYAASGGAKGVCTIVPPDCPAARCGCTPGAVTCTASTLSTCDTDGKSETMTTCSLGCSADATRCATFVPSNGLGVALTMAENETDIELPQHVVVYDAGSIIDMGTGTQVPVKTFTVQQVGVAPIRVFVARSFKIHDADLITNGAGGNNPIAFVATGAIEFDGMFSSPAGFPGPGHQLASAPCAGEGPSTRGGGGGGNATDGGRGAAKAQLPPGPGAAGGPAQPGGFSPLVGGCPGGSAMATGAGGAGGAAYQFVSATSIVVSASGTVSTPGLGGADDEGGGSGGNLVFEAPLVTIDGRLVANGGSGGACGMDGNDGRTDLTPAAAVGGCMGSGGLNPLESGAGGTGTTSPTDAVADSTQLSGGGGGGAAGRASIVTANGMFSQGPTSIISAKVSMSLLVTQ